MGVCYSNNSSPSKIERLADKKIKHMLLQSANDANHVQKVVVIDLCKSGQSGFLKAAEKAQAHEFTLEDAAANVDCIKSASFQCLKKTIRSCFEKFPELKMSSVCQKLISLDFSQSSMEAFTIAEIQELKFDDDVMSALDSILHEGQWCSAVDLLSLISRAWDASWQPTRADVILGRSLIRGVIEITLPGDEYDMQVICPRITSISRAEKLIPIFGGAAVIVIVMDVNDRAAQFEAAELFELVSTSSWFARSSIVLSFKQDTPADKANFDQTSQFVEEFFEQETTDEKQKKRVVPHCYCENTSDLVSFLRIMVNQYLLNQNMVSMVSADIVALPI